MRRIVDLNPSSPGGADASRSATRLSMSSRHVSGHTYTSNSPSPWDLNQNVASSPLSLRNTMNLILRGARPSGTDSLTWASPASLSSNFVWTDSFWNRNLVPSGSISFGGRFHAPSCSMSTFSGSSFAVETPQCITRSDSPVLRMSPPYLERTVTSIVASSFCHEVSIWRSRRFAPLRSNDDVEASIVVGWSATGITLFIE
mmetsp:Transcript_15260/g.36911  ORF Transcript_15260/g.36911 Transcript_15260/m.36911 type:complete len:201 (+) Transcript_15260:1482-2084(+)